MRKKSAVLMVLATVILAPVSAKERSLDFPDFKCHVILENGAEKIVKVSAKDSAMAEKFVASRKQTLSKKEKLSVKSVTECKAKTSSFTSSTARELEANTPD